jgi:hypothetical protein
MDERIPPGGVHQAPRSRDGRAFEEGGSLEISDRLIPHGNALAHAGEARSSTARADASRSGADRDRLAQVLIDSPTYFIDGE